MKSTAGHSVLATALTLGLLISGAVAQEAPPAKPAPPKGPAGERGGRMPELQQRINRLAVEAAEGDPELKALHEAQQAKWRDAQKKRAEAIAADPELQKMQQDLDAKRKQEWQSREELVQKNPELIEMQQQMKDLREKFELKIREVAAASPEAKALRTEVEDLQKKLFDALRANADVQKAQADTDSAWNEMLGKAAEKSPELKKALEERDALMKAGPPPAEKPEKKEEPKE